MIRRRDGKPKAAGEGRWEIRVDLPRKDGPRRQLFRTFRGTLREAQREERRLRTEVEERRLAMPVDVTLSEYLRRWLDGARIDLANTTAARYADLIDKHIIPALGSHRLDQLDRGAIRRAWSERRRQGRLRPAGQGEAVRHDLSPSTIRQMHRVLHRALDQAVSDNILSHNPADRVELPKMRRATFQVLILEQSQTLLDSIAHTAMHVPALLALACGLRRGEVLALRWSDVDLDGARLTVARSLEQVGRSISFKAPKSDRSRTLSIAAFVVEALRRHKAEQAKLRLRLGLGRDDDALVVCKHDGEPVRPRTLTIEFARLIRRVPGVSPVRFHDLRHGFVTLQLQIGVPAKVVSERAGHSSSAFTMDRYGHVLTEMQVDAAERLDAAFKRAAAKGEG